MQSHFTKYQSVSSQVWECDTMRPSLFVEAIKGQNNLGIKWI